MTHWFMILCVGLALIGCAWLFRRRGLTKGQAQQVLNSHTEAQTKVDQAETEAQKQLKENESEASRRLRELASREAQQRKELENADTEEQAILQADKVRRRWNSLKDIQASWLIGLFLLAWALLAGQAHAAVTKAELLGEVKALSNALNDCANTVARERILHKKQLKDQQVHTSRRLKQKDAHLVQCRKEVLVYKSKPPGNTGLVVGITVTSTVAVAAIVLLVVSVIRPEVFGNQKGTVP